MAAPIPLSSFVRDYRPVIDSLADGEVVLSQRGGELLLLSSLRRREGDRHAVAALSHLLAHALERGELVAVGARGEQRGELVPQLVFDRSEPQPEEVLEVRLQRQAVEPGAVEFQLLLDATAHLAGAPRQDVGLGARRAELEADPAHLRSVLAEGNAKADAVAEATLAEVREAMQMVYA